MRSDFFSQGGDVLGVEAIAALGLGQLVLQRGQGHLLDGSTALAENLIGGSLVAGTLANGLGVLVVDVDGLLVRLV